MNFKNLGFDLENLFQVKQFGNRFPYHDLGTHCRHGRKYLKLPKMDGFNTKKYQLTSFLRLDPWVYWIQARIKQQKCGSTQLERSLRPSNLNPIARLVTQKLQEVKTPVPPNRAGYRFWLHIPGELTPKFCRVNRQLWQVVACFDRCCSSANCSAEAKWPTLQCCVWI